MNVANFLSVQISHLLYSFSLLSVYLRWWRTWKKFSGIVLHLSARAAPMACLPRTRLHPPAEGTETVTHCGSTWKERAASWFRLICIEIRAQGYMDGLRSVLHGRCGTARL